MGLREIFGCFGCRVRGGTNEPHRDYPLEPWGVGYVHERCRIDGEEILDSYGPLCTLPDAAHYPYPLPGKDEWPKYQKRLHPPAEGKTA